MKALPLVILLAQAALAGDLSGIWVNTTLTPLERGIARDFSGMKIELPAVSGLAIGGSEAKAYEKALLTVYLFQRGDKSEGDLTGELNPEFTEIVPELLRIGGRKRTSLIVDPADGKIPPSSSLKKSGRTFKKRSPRPRE